MAKITPLNEIASLANTSSAKAALNDNFDRIEEAFENTLSRDGSTPNQMEADLDMNSNDILNAGIVDAESFHINGVPFEQAVAYSSKLYETFNGTGVQQDFPLEVNPASLGNLEVSVKYPGEQGLELLRPGIDFNFAGQVLHFIVAPPAGTDNILVRYDVALPVGIADADGIMYTPPSTGVPESLKDFLDDFSTDFVLYTPPSTGILDTLKAFLDSLWATGVNAGASLIRWIQTGTGAVPRTVESKLREFVSVKDFGAVGDNATDDTAAINAAIASISGNGGTVFFPPGIYLISSTITLPILTYNLRLLGSGSSSILKMIGATSFDMIKGGGNGFNFQSIEALSFSGNALTGSGSLIDTAGIGTMRIHKCFFSALPLTGNGIKANGAGVTYNHETRITDCYIDTTTGFAGIYCGELSSDSFIDNVVIQGRNGVSYCMYFANGSAHWRVVNCHTYGGAIAGVGIAANGDDLWFSTCFFDTGATVPVVRLDSATKCSFTGCHFWGATGSVSLLINNSSRNHFSNCSFEGVAGLQYAVQEVGTSNYNVFDVCRYDGSFVNNPPITLIGAETVFRQKGETTQISGALLTPAAGSTNYIGNGSSATSANVIRPIPFDGLLRKLNVITTHAPGGGQTYTCTARILNSDTSLVATVSGAGGFSAQALGNVNVSAGQFVDIKVVTSGGAVVPGAITVALVIEH